MPWQHQDEAIFGSKQAHTRVHCNSYCQTAVGFYGRLLQKKEIKVFTASKTSTESVCVDDRRAAFSRTVRGSARRATARHANGRHVYTAFTFKTLHSVLTGPVSERGRDFVCVCVSASINGSRIKAGKKEKKEQKRMANSLNN